MNLSYSNCFCKVAQDYNVIDPFKQNDCILKPKCKLGGFPTTMAMTSQRNTHNQPLFNSRKPEEKISKRFKNAIHKVEQFYIKNVVVKIFKIPRNHWNSLRK